MIDLNTLISNALTAAVQQAVAPLNERITALEDTGDRLYARIAVLENNPAQGVEPAITIDEARMVEALNSQEWFWEKLQNRIDSTVEAGIDDHTSTYDHDDYDNHIGDDDKHFDGDIEDAVRDALSNMTFDVSIR